MDDTFVLPKRTQILMLFKKLDTIEWLWYARSLKTRDIDFSANSCLQNHFKFVYPEGELKKASNTEKEIYFSTVPL